MIGLGESALILSAVVLVFGATQIPKLARSVGEGLKEFKKAVKDNNEEETEDDSNAEIK